MIRDVVEQFDQALRASSSYSVVPSLSRSEERLLRQCQQLAEHAPVNDWKFGSEESSERCDLAGDVPMVFLSNAGMTFALTCTTMLSASLGPDAFTPAPTVVLEAWEEHSGRRLLAIDACKETRAIWEMLSERLVWHHFKTEQSQLRDEFVDFAMDQLDLRIERGVVYVADCD